MARDVGSHTRAGLPTDHFPLEVVLRMRLSGGKVDPNQNARWNLKAATPEQKAAFDAEVMERMRAVGAAEGYLAVDVAWTAMRDAVAGAMERHIPKVEVRAKKPWISDETVELMVHRRELAAQGQIGEAQEPDTRPGRTVRNG